jgi:hypothetical protein
MFILKKCLQAIASSLGCPYVMPSFKPFFVNQSQLRSQFYMLKQGDKTVSQFLTDAKEV